MKYKDGLFFKEDEMCPICGVETGDFIVLSDRRLARVTDIEVLMGPEEFFDIKNCLQPRPDLLHTFYLSINGKDPSDDSEIIENIPGDTMVVCLAGED
jgi:hypothetical protein